MYGVHACRAVFNARPLDVIRAYLSPETRKIFGDLMKWCAEKKLAYHLVTDEELAKVTASVHHEGICLLMKKKKPTSEDEALAVLSSQKRKPSVVLFLDGVGNPHNLGAILRSAAHFGVRFIFGTEGSLPEISPSAGRIAEGASEHVELVCVKKPGDFLKRLQKSGFSLYSTECHTGESLYKTALARHSCFIIGAEIEGVSKVIGQLCDKKITIPNTQLVESLNVSVATGIVLGEAYRQHHIH